VELWARSCGEGKEGNLKAAELHGPRDLRLVEIPKPLPLEDQVLLKVEACGVCGSDTRTWRSGPPRGQGPLIMGHEVVGTVVAKGPAAPKEFQEGSRWALGADINCGSCYFCMRGLYNLCLRKKIIGRVVPGGFAEYMLLDTEMINHGIFHPVMEGFSASDATLAEPLSSVVHLQERICVGPEDFVVVFGAGPIGCLHVELAHIRGARTALVEVSEKRWKLARELLPVDHLINAKHQSPVALVKELTGGLGADVAIVACPSASAQAQAVELVRKRGKVVVFGGLPEGKPFATLNANLIHYGEISVIGAFSYSPRHHALALELITSGKIKARKYITEFSLEELPQVFETLSDPERGTGILKAVVLP